MKSMDKKKYISEIPELMKEWDWEANADLDPNKITCGSHIKAWWKCPKCGYKWKATIANRASRHSGCPACNGTKVIPGISDLAITHPEITKDWDFDDNGNLRPEQFKASSPQKINWKCHICGQRWPCTIINRVKGSKCPNCYHTRVLVKGCNDFATLYPEIVLDWNIEKNGNKKPSDYFPGSKEKIFWKCHKCGYEWQSSIVVRTKGHSSCHRCNNSILISGENDLRTLYPKICEEWDYEKNGELNPENIKPGSKTKIWWKCKVCGHSWKASVSDRVSKSSGCPSCIKHIRTSFPEQAFFYYIRQVFPNSVGQYKPDFLNRMELDIFIPEINYAIEYDGSHWHTSKDVEHEQKKYQLCQQKNIKVIRIKEDDITQSNIKTADYIFEISKKRDNKILTCTIKELITFLDPNQLIDINLTRDEQKIREMYLGNPKNSLAIKNPEIAQEWDYEKNGNIKPSNITQYAQYKAHWKCSKCGKHYVTTVANRTYNKSGCPYCTHQKVLTGVNDLATQYPELAKQWHPTKNENLKPSEIFSHSNKKVWWLCSKGHSFLQAVHNRTEGQKCPYCSSRKLLPSFNDLATKNPELASEWHPTRNKDLIPSDVMPGSNKKVWWLCKKCGYEWQAIINNRSGKKSGCPKCVRKK